MKFLVPLLAGTLMLACHADSYGSQPDAPTVKRARRPIVDVLLHRNAAGKGSVTGALVDGQGKPVARETVWLRGKGTAPTRTMTDAKGRFAFPGLSSGLYELATRAGTGQLRAWEESTAPPTVRQSVLLVQNQTPQVVRGQDGGPPIVYDDGFVEGGPGFDGYGGFGGGGGGYAGPRLGRFIVPGLAIGGATAAIVALSDDDNRKGS